MEATRFLGRPNGGCAVKKPWHRSRDCSVVFVDHERQVATPHDQHLVQALAPGYLLVLAWTIWILIFAWRMKESPPAQPAA
jgi:hypothetical protein